MSGTLPDVVGDPAGMRALATALRSTANTVGAIDSTVYGKTSTVCFIGPASVRLQVTIDQWHRDASRAAQELEAAANLLDRSASAVEDELAARARLEQQLAEEQRKRQEARP